MTIERIVNGKTYSFTLTEREMREAYWEQQTECDREDIESYMEQFLDYEDGVTEKEARESLAEITQEYRKLMDELDWWEKADTAYRAVLC